MEDKKLQEKDLGQVSGGKISTFKGERHYVIPIYVDGPTRVAEVACFLSNEMKKHGEEAFTSVDELIYEHRKVLDEIVHTVETMGPRGFDVWFVFHDKMALNVHLAKK